MRSPSLAFAAAVLLAVVAASAMPGVTAGNDDGGHAGHEHDDDDAASAHVYGRVCAANNWTACAIRVPLADQAAGNPALEACTCYESPDIVPQAKAKAFFALNYISLPVKISRNTFSDRSALHCTATARILILAQCSAVS